MGKKGFTLVELLAVIIILGIVSTITVVSVSSAYNESKKKSEEVFIANITKAVEAYYIENKGNFTFTIPSVEPTKYTKYNINEGECTDVNTDCKATITKTEFDFGIIVENGLLTAKDVINPNDEQAVCYTANDLNPTNNTKVNVYKDSDYVYCFTLELDCLRDQNGAYKKISTCPSAMGV